MDPFGFLRGIFGLIMLTSVLVGFSILIYRFGTMKPWDSAKMIVSNVILLAGVAFIVAPIGVLGVSWLFENWIATGPLAVNFNRQFATAGAAVSIAETAAPASTSESPTAAPTLAPTDTPAPTPVTVLPTATTGVMFFKVYEPPKQVVIRDGLAELTLYDVTNNRTFTVAADTPLFVCAVTEVGSLVGCPKEDLILFSANDIQWEDAGVELPPTPTVAPPPDTPIPAFTATPDEATRLAICFSKWQAWTQRTDLVMITNGTDLVPRGVTAEVTGAGRPVWVPGSPDWTIRVTGFPGMPTLDVPEEQVAGHIDGALFNKTVPFTGTGDQCDR